MAKSQMYLIQGGFQLREKCCFDVIPFVAG